MLVLVLVLVLGVEPILQPGQGVAPESGGVRHSARLSNILMIIKLFAENHLRRIKSLLLPRQ